MRALTALTVALLGATLSPPVTALAACAAPTGPPVLSEYDQVFAGFVERTTNGGAAAQVRVLDVWHGPDLPLRVVVIGGQLQPNVSSSVDRSYASGQRYGFFVQRADDGSLHDNSCTPTGPLASLAAVDPPGTREPEQAAAAPTDPRSVVARSFLPTAAGVAVVSAAAGAFLLVAYRRSLRRSRRT